MINWQRVGDLRDDVGEDDFGEVVELFLEEVAEVVARLTDSPDPAEFENELHFLKGSALNLGFDKLGAACADGERLAKFGKTEVINITAVIEAYETSIAAFKNGITQGLAA